MTVVQWLKRPLSDPDLLDDRLNTIEFLLELRNTELRKNLSKAIHGLADTTRIINRIQQNRHSVDDWVNLVRSCRAAQEVWVLLRDAVATIDHRERVPPLFDDIMTAFNPRTLDWIAHKIVGTLDLKSSEQQGRFIISSGHHRDLDGLKHHYEGMNNFLNQIALNEGTKLFQCQSLFANLDLRVVFYVRHCLLLQ